MHCSGLYRIEPIKLQYILEVLKFSSTKSIKSLEEAINYPQALPLLSKKVMIEYPKTV